MLLCDTSNMYFIYIHRTIEPVFAESAIKHQPTKLKLFNIAYRFL